MKKTGLIWGILIGLGIIISWATHNLFYVEPNLEAPVSTKNTIHHSIEQQAQYTIHTVTIPHNSNYSIFPALESELTPITDFAIKHDAIAVINGGYFDPVNQKTTSYIIQQGKIVADPRTNERLIDNPDLKQYLGKILNRTEFRRYLCTGDTRYDIVLHSAPIPSDCQLQDSLGGGPGLLPQDTSVAEAFTAYQDGEIIRDAIGSSNLNARSAIGITNSGDIVLVMVTQKSNAPRNSGISLPGLTNFLTSIDVEKAMNLDGGSSAALYFQDQTFYGKVDKEGNEIKRPIKSVLLVVSG